MEKRWWSWHLLKDVFLEEILYRKNVVLEFYETVLKEDNDCGTLKKRKKNVISIKNARL